MSSFATYLIGFIVLIAGLAYGAYLLNIPQTWIVVGVIVLAGGGIVSATSRTKMRDPGAGEPTHTDSQTTVVEHRPPTTPNA
jgi:hypothetical protein